MHLNSSQCIAQPDTALLDCMLYLTQHLYDPGRQERNGLYDKSGMDQKAKRSQRAHNVSNDASTTSKLPKCTMLFTAATVLSFIVMILVALSPDGVLREQATVVAAQSPILVGCSKPFQRSEKQRQELVSNHIASALLTSLTYSQAMPTVSCQICESWSNGTFETFEAMLNYRTDAAQPTGSSEICDP